MLKHKGTYEIMSPEEIGLERSNDAGIVLGKLRYGSFVVQTDIPNGLVLFKPMLTYYFIQWASRTERPFK